MLGFIVSKDTKKYSSYMFNPVHEWIIRNKYTGRVLRHQIKQNDNTTLYIEDHTWGK